MPNSTTGIPNGIEKDFPADAALCLYAIGGAIGYLHAHLEEVKRLKSVVVELDAALNKGAIQRSENASGNFAAWNCWLWCVALRYSPSFELSQVATFQYLRAVNQLRPYTFLTRRLRGMTVSLNPAGPNHRHAG